MTTTTVKVSALTGAALDWTVAKCEGLEVEYINDGITQCLLRLTPFTGRYSPSSDWSQGGPIIERERIVVDTESGTPWSARFGKSRVTFDGRAHTYHHQEGPTPLIASMRCYVASKLGDTIEAPLELIK